MPRPGFNSHICDLRFVQLVDGRKILQLADAAGDWHTPHTVAESELTPEEHGELLRAITSG